MAAASAAKERALTTVTRFGFAAATHFSTTDRLAKDEVRRDRDGRPFVPIPEIREPLTSENVIWNPPITP